MKIGTKRDDLQHAISTVARAVSTRSTLPILSNILLEAEGERLTLSATDLEIGIRASLSVEVEEPGRTTVAARLFGEVIGAQSAGAPLLVEADDQDHLVLRCGRGVMEVNGLPADEFPVIPAIDGATKLVLPQALLKRMIQQCIVAVSTDETRARLTGMQFLATEGTLRLVATDSHRLATRRAELAEPLELNAIIPSRALREVERQLVDAEDAMVELDFTEAQVQFRLPRVTIISRLIEGEFANYRRALPTSHEWTISGPLALLREAVRRCEIVSREDTHKLVLRATAAGELHFSAHSSKIGSAEEEVDGVAVTATEGTSDPLEIAFNAKYLSDVLNLLDCDEVRLEMAAANQPAAIKPVSDEDYVYVLMPMQMG